MPRRSIAAKRFLWKTPSVDHYVAMLSRNREFHPIPLTEPYVKVSLHTALQVRVTISGYGFAFELLLFINSWLSIPELVSPFAPVLLQNLHHYYELIRHLMIHQ